MADRFLGLQFLQDLSEFFLAFEGMYDGFKERAARVHALVRDACSGFLLVTGPSPLAVDEALYFHRRLDEKQMPFLAFVVNRVHPRVTESPMVIGRVQRRTVATRDSDGLPDPAGAGGAGTARTARLHPDLRERILDCYDDQQVLFRTEAKTIARLEVETGDRPVLVPEMDQDVHDLRGLRQVAEALSPSPAAAAPRRRASS
jgi:anion-transporting  ArsA/GET3 family ATPase